MPSECITKQLEQALQFFNRSTSELTEDNSSYAPAEGMYTTSQQVAHVAHVVEWFVDGALGKGWDMDFAAQDAKVRAVTSLASAREWLAAAFARASSELSAKSEELASPFPADDPIMPSAPKSSVVGGIADHTAHHRGALTVYARLLGKVPPMPYM